MNGLGEGRRRRRACGDVSKSASVLVGVRWQVEGPPPIPVGVVRTAREHELGGELLTIPRDDGCLYRRQLALRVKEIDATVIIEGGG